MKLIELIEKFIRYLKWRPEINAYYGYALKGKNGEQVDEGYNWLQKLAYWERAE